jgi:hypothetical protein
MCEWRPRLKTDEEIIKAFKEDMAQDLETIEGTQEQADKLAEIDGAEREGLDSSPILSQPDSSDRNDDSPPKPIERSPDYSGMSFNEAVGHEFDYLQKMTERTGNECMSIMTNGKKVSGTWEGGPNNINSDEKMLDILDKSTDNSLNLLHTHTRNVGFSGVDLGTMCEYTSIDGINAKCPDGSEYHASIGAMGKRPVFDEVKDLAAKELRELIKNPRYSNMKPDDVRWAALIRKRNEILRKKYNWDLR